jgi:hypothetical protein
VTRFLARSSLRFPNALDDLDLRFTLHLGGAEMFLPDLLPFFVSGLSPELLLAAKDARCLGACSRQAIQAGRAGRSSQKWPLSLIRH